MAGRGPAPKTNRRGHDELGRGDWKTTSRIGWQHGDVPPPPKVRAASKRAWDRWFRSWFAAYWTVDDLPGLEHLIEMHSLCDAAKHAKVGERRLAPFTELRQLMDSYGITPKGQQDRRWLRPSPPPPSPAADPAIETMNTESPYAHLLN